MNMFVYFKNFTCHEIHLHENNHYEYMLTTSQNKPFKIDTTRFKKRSSRDYFKLLIFFSYLKFYLWKILCKNS
jgi:hypothetical protein